MSIFSSIKKVLGFPDEYDEDDDELRDLRSPDDDNNTATQQATAETPETPATTTAADALLSESNIAAAPAPAIENELPGKIFDAVIELFNSTQPEFVANCLNIDSQRAYILENIDKNLQATLKDIALAARNHGEEQWNIIRAQKAAELDRLMTDYNALKLQREEHQSEQLSSKRQKRALVERVRDLEATVASQTAEIEQYQLENQSMASRLRAMTVRNGIVADDPAQALSEENVALQDRLAALEKQLEEANTRTAEANTQIEQLNKQLDEANEPDHISEEQQAAIAEIEERMKQFEEIKAKKDKKIAALTDDIKRISLEASDNLAQRDALQSMLEQLGSEMEKLRTENERLHTDVDTLRQEKQTPVTTPAATDAEVEQLRNEVRRLTDLINSADVEPQQKQKRGRKKKNREISNDIERSADTSKPADAQLPLLDVAPASPAKISAIDELMDSTDWFKAPDPIPIKKDPEVEEEFGYKEPVRKPTLDNEKQLSLF